MQKNKVRRILYACAWQSHTLAASVAEYAVKAGWHLNMSFFISAELPREWDGDGILAVMSGRPDLALLLKTARCPIVSMSANRNGLDIPYVDVDNEQVGVLAAEHFLKRHFRHFAYYSHLDGPVAQMRGDGFARTLKQAGHACEWMTWNRRSDRRWPSSDSSQRWLQETLQNLPKPLAVLAVDDLRAGELIEAGLRLGLSIPDELAILGVGNHSLLSHTTAVPLSSVMIDEVRLGYEAARMLDACMSGRRPPSKPLLIAPSGIVERKSTEAIATEHPELAKSVRFMLNNYREPIGMREIVAATAVSQARIYQLFHAEFGQSPARFLTHIRLEKAKTLLRESNDKIAVIADECGFGDPINLFRVFKSSEGLSATQYRQAHRTSQPAAFESA